MMVYKMDRKTILLFGSSYMAEEYLKVLKAFDCEVLVIGRNEEKAETLANKYGFRGMGKGEIALDKIDANKIDLTIIASAVDSLKDLGCACIGKGLNNILVEKPGALNLKELQEIKRNIKAGVNLRVAYNRRFYNSVLLLKEKIAEDGGVLGCYFDFTDREKDIMESVKSKGVVKRWGFANSSHVIDTAFYLIGMPKEIKYLRSGSWEVHPSGNVFVGCGKTDKCLFSFFSTWAGGGRWDVEISTAPGRYRLSPMEELYFCKKNQFIWEKIELPDNDDQKYKPGLYKMIKNVLFENNYDNMPDINDQIKL
jgi:predicted dehydrogenase